MSYKGVGILTLEGSFVIFLADLTKQDKKT